MKGIARENLIATVLNFFLSTGIFLAVLLIMIIRVIQQRTMDTDLGMIFTGLFCFVLTIRILIAIAHLASVSRVLQHQITPKNLWQASLKSECQTLLRDYLVAASTLIVHFLIAAPTSLIFSLMLMSLSCVLSVMFGLANNGFLNLKWQRIILFLYGLAIITLLASRTTTIVFNSLHQISTVLLLVIAALMPAMLIWQIKRPVDRLLVNVSTTETSTPGLLERIRREIKRYTLIQTKMNQGATNFVFNNFLFNPFLSVYVPVLLSKPLHVSLSGETGVSGSRLFLMFALTVMMSNQLMVRDVHWRYLLRPGGLERKNLASNILFSTLRVQCTAYLLLVCLALTIGFLIAPQWTYEALLDVPRYWRIPFEWVAMFTLAISPSLMKKWFRIAFLIMLSAVFIYWLIHLPTFSNKQEWVLFPANYIYIAGLMLFSFCTMRINNRQWTARLLFEKLK
ncbi:hypothetical protein [Undibacterium sp. SXout20W]|uniref:hypothetical protein n=1 Tax=Undibacterium sp. SXout20W TaxID=3413051 RepID=UPI003BF3AC33